MIDVPPGGLEPHLALKALSRVSYGGRQEQMMAEMAGLLANGSPPGWPSSRICIATRELPLVTRGVLVQRRDHDTPAWGLRGRTARIRSASPQVKLHAPRVLQIGEDVHRVPSTGGASRPHALVGSIRRVRERRSSAPPVAVRTNQLAPADFELLSARGVALVDQLGNVHLVFPTYNGRTRAPADQWSRNPHSCRCQAAAGQAPGLSAATVTRPAGSPR